MWATCVRTVAIIGGVLAWVMPLAASADDQCRIQISQPVMDFGVFNSGELTTRTTRPNMVSLGKRQLQLSVTCPDPVRIAVTFHGMASGAGGFRMGDMGEFTLTFKDARLDGSEVLLGRASRAEELPLKVEDAVRLLPNSYASPVVSGHLGVGRVFTVGVEIEAQVKAEVRKVRDRSILDGDGQFEVVTGAPAPAQGAL